MTRARRPSKARHAADCTDFLQLPNVGPAMAGDLHCLGLTHPQQLAACDAHVLYRRLSELTGRRQDPCVLDTFLAIIDFMRGAPPRPWWAYTAQRKRDFPDVGLPPAQAWPATRSAITA
jgi:Pathogenicity locus